MQPIVVAEPYRFVPPHRGGWWPRLLGRVLVPRLLRSYGVTSLRWRGIDRLRASFAAGHGVMLTPNHCRPCDPLVLAALARAAGRATWTMASWHLFKQGRMQAWVLRHAGVFSVWREGLDREALRLAGELLAEARRPLVLFPEGVVTRSNDRLIHLMEGTAFIARAAARSRGDGGAVVIHPVGLRYFHDGDTAAAVDRVLTTIERRLTWRPRADLAPAQRIQRVGGALLALKEIEFLGAAQAGDLAERIARLIDHLLVPREEEWLAGRRDPAGVVARVKALRSAIVPDLAAGELPEAERTRRWDQLADLYLAQQLALYPPGYLASDAEPERLLETVERFEEDLTDAASIHPPLRVVAEVGEAIPVAASRERTPGGDPLMERVRSGIEGLVAGLRGARGDRS